ncbi:hypothetical protein Z043_101799 [Scleropages formosus]|uniref:Collagen alpha-1(XIV) chain-like n=1 Tax=Scleropages formosus TaxID=113540 RepID=A0A0P7VX91_SCLFO|nr:hypothetical protein Z043_101799 [Scleropages formosus]
MSDQFVCTTPAIADIVILVDGSWSIGRVNFRLVRLFLENLVKAFTVGFDKTRIGLAQYSGDPRIEWHLNAFNTKEAVLEAVNNLPYKGGNTLTGLALTYILENSFKPESGARPGVPKIGILITDGKSQDDVLPPAQSLRDSGVELFAIGVKNADENELKAIASDPDETHVYNVADFSIMSTIVEGLTKTVCERVEEQDKEIKATETGQSLEGPQDLEISEVTSRSFRVSWSHALGDVRNYQIVYHPSQDGTPEEILVDGSENSVVLKALRPHTEYQIAVFAVYPNAASEALRGVETTRALPSVSDLELYDVTQSSMKARWKAAEGATGYLVVHAMATPDEIPDSSEVKVKHSKTNIELHGLIPDTEYIVTVYAMHGEETSDPSTIMETTLPLLPPRNMRFWDVDHSSARVTWDSPSSEVTGYRVAYAKSGGSEFKEVEAGQGMSVVLTNLTSLSEYTVAVFGIYDNGQADPLTGSFTTEPVPEPQNLRTTAVSTESFQVSWDHAAQDVVLYRLSWKPTGGRDAKEMLVTGSLDSILISELQPLTEYEVSLLAIFAGDVESKAVTTLETTWVRNLLIDGETTSSFRVSWNMLDPTVQRFRVSFISLKGGGPEEEVSVPGRQNSVMLQPLLPDTQYKVTVTPVYVGRDGTSVSSVGNTLPLSPPSKLRVSEEWYNRFRVSWDPPPSPTSGYWVIYQPISVPSPAVETFVRDDVNTLLIPNLQSDTDYDVKVVASYPAGSSDALLGKGKTLELFK